LREVEYRATIAEWKAERAARRPKGARLAGNDRLRGRAALLARSKTRTVG
jgi:hypothetical protein